MATTWTIREMTLLRVTGLLIHRAQEFSQDEPELSERLYRHDNMLTRRRRPNTGVKLATRSTTKTKTTHSARPAPPASTTATRTTPLPAWTASMASISHKSGRRRAAHALATDRKAATAQRCTSAPLATRVPSTRASVPLFRSISGRSASGFVPIRCHSVEHTTKLIVVWCTDSRHTPGALPLCDASCRYNSSLVTAKNSGAGCFVTPSAIGATGCSACPLGQCGTRSPNRPRRGGGWGAAGAPVGTRTCRCVDFVCAVRKHCTIVYPASLSL